MRAQLCMSKSLRIHRHQKAFEQPFQQFDLVGGRNNSQIEVKAQFHQELNKSSGKICSSSKLQGEELKI